MFKKTMFQLHWFFGISAGLVLAIMGVTGALYSFEGEIVRLINADRWQVQANGRDRLEPVALMAKVEADTGDKVSGIWMDARHEVPARVFLSVPAGERRGPVRYVDPYTAEAMDEPVGQDFFRVVMELHRWLALGDIGKQITAASTLALIFFCLSGLYLRWPRQVGNWRNWLTLDWSKTGRAFNWDLHAVIGTWVLLFYLCAALTGLYWSYGWYRDGLTRLLSDAPVEQREGGRRGARSASEAAPPEVDPVVLWQTVKQAVGADMAAWNLRLPAEAGQPAMVFYILRDAEHVRAFNQLQIDPVSGAVQRHERYADKSFKAQLLSSVYALHVGEYFGLPGRILMLLASAAMPLFFITGWLLYLDRRRKKKAVRLARGNLVEASSTDGWLVGFASQSGYAEQLAWQSASQLQAAGLPVRVEPLSRIDDASLRQARNAVFVLSTFGDGEAPDSALGFERRVLAAALPLEQLNYAVLALGDRQYRHFCGFARRVDDWLGRQGARSLLERVEVDGEDPAALQHWRQQLGELTGTAPLVFEERPWGNWALLQRQCLNPESQGAPVFKVVLAPPSLTTWEAGDILEIRPRHPQARVEAWLQRHGLDGTIPVALDGLQPTLAEALCERQLPDTLSHLVGLHAQALVDALVPLGAREYSIASVAADGVLELIVRQERRGDGSLGLGSGWLTAYLEPGATVSGRLRRNSGFHLPADDAPLILIGNGTGLAGLRSLLRARALAGQRRNWLLFGERNRVHDFFCGAELEAALASGDLQYLDLAFSRDQADKVYVQDLLRQRAERVHAWLAEGALLYVCGSLTGMAAGVDEALRDLLGADGVQALIEDGRYRRDVY